MKSNFLKLSFLLTFFPLFNSALWAFDADIEGRLKAGSSFVDGPSFHKDFDSELELRLGRSEERRVGKECRSRWSTYH